MTVNKHDFTHFFDKSLLKHYSVCACGQRSERGTEQQREDWELRHLRNVERALASLSRRNPSLKGQRDYYAKMAVEATDPHQRRLWSQLEQELSARLDDGGTEEDAPLFDI